MSDRPRYLFITGRLAEPALRATLAEIAPKVAFEAEVHVMPITVAALLSVEWIARRLQVEQGIERVILPGFCRGDLTALSLPTGTTCQRGPKDLRDLPEYFGLRKHARPIDLSTHDTAIIAEINHAPRMSLEELCATALRLREAGADLIDLGCEPGTIWQEVGDAVALLKDAGLRVSIDSFQPQEVANAIRAGAELVLSVNSSNIEHVPSWLSIRPDVEVVAIPDEPSHLDSLYRTIERLEALGCRYRLDPILEPIGFGFAASLGRYADVRRRLPNAEMMMGVGNVTELTDVDSAGINVLLAGFCRELRIRSVLTTSVIPWCRTAVEEFDRARRLVHHAVTNRTLPKHVNYDLVMLRDPRVPEFGEAGLAELARRITDRNYRIFAERGEIHILNATIYLHGRDPFALFEELRKADEKLDASHSFYLGYEFAKAVTALTLGKDYRQDQALRWGFLTVPEVSHRGS